MVVSGSRTGPWSIAEWRKYARSPPDESQALLCPNLTPTLMRPALALSSASLQQALTDRDKMFSLVAGYRAAVPKAAAADVMEALSTAYGRSLADDRISQARMTAQLAEFALQVIETIGYLAAAVVVL